MISGFICTRNAIELDYCVELAIQSLLPVCAEVVVSDGESTDRTRDILGDLAAREPKIRIVTYPWPNPKSDIKWWVTWLNTTRNRLQYPMMLELDADEVLDPLSYPAVRAAAERGECRWFQRLNFWRDAQHLAPSGHYCGDQVVRLAPSHLYMCSDEPCIPEAEIRLRAGWPPNATRDFRIFHYGALRHDKAFIEKIRVVGDLFFGTYDERIAKAAREGTPWIDAVKFEELHDGKIIERELQPFNEPHPALAWQWLLDRGYHP